MKMVECVLLPFFYPLQKLKVHVMPISRNGVAGSAPLCFASETVMGHPEQGLGKILSLFCISIDQLKILGSDTCGCRAGKKGKCYLLQLAHPQC